MDEKATESFIKIRSKKWLKKLSIFLVGKVVKIVIEIVSEEMSKKVDNGLKRWTKNG